MSNEKNKTDDTHLLPIFYPRHRSPSPVSARSVNTPLDLSQDDFQFLLTSFQLMDISEDMSFIALIDEAFTLHVCGITWEKGVMKPRPNTYWSRDISIHNHSDTTNQLPQHGDLPSQHESCTYPVYTFLSVASETGYVAVSFAQLYVDSGLFLEGMLDPNYKKCGIYKGSRPGDETYTEFQGRAVFTKEGLALIGNQKLTLLDPRTFKHRYFLDLSEIKRGHEAIIVTESLAKNTTWAKFYPTRGNPRYESQKRKDGDTLITITRHIKHSILVATHKGYITKIWSIRDGSLIESFKTTDGEHMAAISNNERYFATYNDKTKKLIVYLKDGTLPLHKYTRKLVENENENEDDESDNENGNHNEHEYDENVSFVHFDHRRHYLLVAGTKVSSHQRPKVFFEVWSMSYEKCLIHREVDSPEMISLPFIIEDEASSCLEKEKFEYPYFATAFYGLFVTRDDRNNMSMRSNETLLFDQKTVKFENGYLGDDYSIKRISRDYVRLKHYNHEITETLDTNKNLVAYLISHEDERYILRYGLNMIQLWKLNEIDLTKSKKAEGFDFGSEEATLSHGQDDDRDQKLYHNSIKDSTLLYIRSFKGQNYAKNSTFRDDWKMKLDAASLYRPKIYFMEDKGRVLIDITFKNQSIKDEIFLPLPGLEPDIPSIPNPSCSSSSTETQEQQYPVFYHEVESFSQSLHYLHFFLKKRKGYLSTKSKELRQTEILFKKTLESLEAMLSAGDIVGYLNTESGNKTLAMLASFPDGQNVIVKMVRSQNIDIPLKITSYPISPNQYENALTVLIQEERHDLFQLLFNIEILGHHAHGTADWASLTHSFLYLKKEKIPDLLLMCIQRLSYLPVNPKDSGVSNSEHLRSIKSSHLDDSTQHHLEKYNTKTLDYHIIYILKWIFKSPFKLTATILKFLFSFKFNNNFSLRASRSSTRISQICIAPLSNSDMFDIIEYASSAEKRRPIRDANSDSRHTGFEEEYTMVEVIIDNKWRNYGLIPFIITLLIQITYYVSYTLSISFPEEVFGYTPGTEITDSRHWGCLGLTMATGLFMFGQEVIQMKNYKLEYFKSVYNYIDIFTFIFPIITASLLRTNNDHLYEFSSITSLILCIDFILRLRVFPIIGIVLQIIIQLTREVYPTLLFTTLLVVSFTLSLIVLLRRQDDSFFRDQFEGSSTTTDALNSNVTLNDQSQQNLFTDAFFGFTTVWFFLYGVFDPMFSGDIGNYRMGLVLIILFSFSTALILLNVVIAIMNGSIQKTVEKGNRNWYIHFIAVISELDMFWGWLIKRYNPPYIYYRANRSTVLLHFEKIKEETEHLLSRRDLISRTAFETGNSSMD